MNLQSDSRNNTGGIHKFYFAHINQIKEEINGEIILNDGELWSEGFATRFSLDYRERVRFSRSGKLKSLQMEGFLPKLSPTLESILNGMLGEPYVIVYRDYNQNVRHSGSKHHPLFFEYSIDPGKRPGSNSGVTFTFSGNQLSQQNIFEGALNVGDDDVITPPSSSEPVLLKWGTTVIAIAQPGETIQINSEFKSTEIIIL